MKAGETARIKQTLSNVANRYIGENPPNPFVFRAFQREGILGNEQYDFHFNLNERFPDAKDGESVYACAKIWMDQPADVQLRLNCYCPAVVYANGKMVYRSTYDVEINKNRFAEFQVQFADGWTHITIQFTKRASGFGGLFGPPWAKWSYLLFQSPGEERKGQIGWIFTEPSNRPLVMLPHEGWSEVESGALWLPRRQWSESELALGQMQRMYGLLPGHYGIGWVKLWFPQKGMASYTLKGSSEGKIEIAIGGRTVYQSESVGAFEVEILEPNGIANIVVKTHCGPLHWGFQLEIWQQQRRLAWIPATDVKGVSDTDAWLYLGPFPEQSETELDFGRKLDFENTATMYALFGDLDYRNYWRVDLPEMRVRPSLENARFGKWNYPLGVTLYGLLQSGRKLQRHDVISYVRRHIEECTSMYAYTMWDKEQYGLPGINHQLSQIDALDDCGSFGSTVLEACAEGRLPGALEAAEFIAEHITMRQSRLPEGALYRVSPHSATLWADDLYMSVPFLCRYFALTGDIRYVDDAAKQFLLFKKYLFMPDYKIFSHVYDFSYDTPTNIPWGRGNGWVLFSLSELLAALPLNHPARTELLNFYKEFSDGVLQLQGANGFWHQVLTDQTSYEETSCTAMFVYALSRGIRYGWIEPTDSCIEAVMKGWSGIERLSIDKQGNVHGVCRGSWYSFNPDYYKYDLQPLLNDTHGIGIVLLAGVEVINLMEWLQGESKLGV